jgi:hypothetical protein
VLNMPNNPLLEHIASEFAISNNLKFLCYSGMGAFKETYCVTNNSNLSSAV